MDTALPFGLRLAPKIFTAVADVVVWIVRQEGVHFIIHYLNDYLVIWAPVSPECADVLTALFGVFDRLENHASKRTLDQVISDITVCDILHIRMRDTQWHIL